VTFMSDGEFVRKDLATFLQTDHHA